VIVIGHLEVCSDVLLSFVIDRSVMLRAMGQLRKAELGIVVVPEGCINCCQHRLREDSKGRGKMFCHVEIRRVFMILFYDCIILTILVNLRVFIRFNKY
jgi:hypothetical protein